MKYDLANIMTHAWKLVKSYGYTMSKALVSSWRKAKQATELVVETVVKETEKAIAIVAYYEGYNRQDRYVANNEKLVWLPKSMVQASNGLASISLATLAWKARKDGASFLTETQYVEAGCPC